MRHLKPVVIVALLLAVSPAASQAATQSREDPSDAPAGTSGKADLRKVAWDVGGGSATLGVSLDESTFDPGAQPADIGVHVLVDHDGDGLADHEVEATRNADDVRIDVVLREL